MKVLIIGGGSIGQRHLMNLKNLGIKKISVFDSDNKKRKEIEKKHRVNTYTNINLALKENWDIVFICTPPSTHIKIALKLIEKKVPIFIEKPLSNDLKNIPNLIKKINKYKIPVMIGYNLNFHPQIQEIKKILQKNILGKIWGSRVEYGQYLPDWRPCQDYKKSYSAQKKLGGGIVLDDIHEIDYLYYLFGKVNKIFGLVEKISNLKINTEDYAEIILWFKNGPVGEIHMDYLQRVASRNIKIIGEKGTLTLDLKKSELSYFLLKDKKWHVKKIKNFDYNQTYIREIKHFLKCIKNKKSPEPNINRGYETLKIALAAKKSARSQKVINL